MPGESCAIIRRNLRDLARLFPGAGGCYHPRMQQAAEARLLKSVRFRNWRPTWRDHVGLTPVTERHYSPSELGKVWGVSGETIRNIFREEPGVLRFNSKRTKAARKYVSMRIPVSVAERVHKRLSAVPI
jgi:hypothetical protein